MLVCYGCANSSKYFPRDTLSDYQVDAYSYDLRQFDEKPIRPDGNTQVYRFLRMPSFSPDVLVRIEHGQQGTLLVAKTVRADGIAEVSKQLSPDEWQNFIGEVYSSSFWLTAGRARNEYATQHLPRELGLSSTIITYTDGERWLIEASNGDIYHAADAHSPDDGAIYTLGSLLMTMAGLSGEGQ